MKWLALGIQLASRIPFEQFIFRHRPSEKKEEELLKILEDRARSAPAKTPVFSESYDEHSGKKIPQPAAPVAVMERRDNPVSTQETVDYQRREIAKEFFLLEKHLQQHCQIGGKPCDCCEKHPIIIEGLAQEVLGMENDPLYSEIIEWAREVSPMTTQTASESGKYYETYPQLAIAARTLRKRMMGTTDIAALMTPDTKEKAEQKLKKIIDDLKGPVAEGGKENDGTA